MRIEYGMLECALKEIDVDIGSFVEIIVYDLGLFVGTIIELGWDEISIEGEFVSGCYPDRDYTLIKDMKQWCFTIDLLYSIKEGQSIYKMEE